MKRKILLMTLVMMLLFVGHSFSQSETIDYSIATGNGIVSVDKVEMTLEVLEGTEVQGLKDSVNVLTSPAAIEVYETSGGAVMSDYDRLYNNNVLEISSNDLKEVYIIETVEPIRIENYSSDMFYSYDESQILVRSEFLDWDIGQYRLTKVSDFKEVGDNLYFNYSSEDLTFEVLNSDKNLIVDETLNLKSGMYLKVSKGSLENIYQVVVTTSDFGIESADSDVIIDNNNTAIKYPYGYSKNALEQILTGAYDYSEAYEDQINVNQDDSFTVFKPIDGKNWAIDFWIEPYIKLDSDNALVISEDIYTVKIDETQNPIIQDVINLYNGIEGFDYESLFIEKDGTLVKDYNLPFDSQSGYELFFEMPTGETLWKFIDVSNQSDISDNSGDSSGNYDNSDSEIEYLDFQFIGEASKLFKEEVVYLKANETYEVIVEAYDVNDETVSIENLNIDVGANFGTDPTFEERDGKYYLTTAYVSGGYGDSFWGSIQVNDYETEFKVNTYKGKLLLLDLTDFEGNPYDGWAKYHISYELETGDSNSSSGTGSNSNGVVYDGVLPIPIQGDYVGVNYAYVIAAPENTIEMANTKFIDLTGALSESMTKDFVSLDEPAIFQAPEFTGTVYTRDEEPWNRIYTNVYFEYVGEDYDMHLVSGPSAINGNQFVLASLGEAFSKTFNLTIGSYNAGQISIERDNININLEKEDFISPKPQVKGWLLDPRTDDLIKNGHGRDTRVYISGEDYFDYGTDNAEFLLNGFENGKTYQIYAYIEPGDFYDENLTDTKTYEFTYDDTKEEISLESMDTDETITMIKDSSTGVYQLDLYATESIIRGRVFTGNENLPMTTHTDVSLYNQAGELVSSSYTTSSQFVDEEDNQGYFMLGGTTIEPGTYYIEIDAPIDSINYSDYRQKVELPLAEGETFNIILPESKVYGNIIGESLFESVRNVYVNIFDAFGNYIKNGRVRADGKFAVGNLDAGRYYSKVFVSPYSDLSEAYTSSKKVAFEVESDEKVNFDVPLTRKMYSGTLLNNDRENWIRIFDANMNEVEAIKSDADGAYNLPLLDDDAYFIKAYSNEKFDSILEKITVINGELSGLDKQLALSTDPNIQLNLVNDTSNPLEGEVIVYDADKKFITFANSVEGKAFIGGLASGTYFVEVKPFDANYVRSEFIEITIEETLTEKTVELSEASIVGTINADAGWVYLLRDNTIVSTSEIIDGNFSLPSLQTDETYEVYGVPEDQGLYKTERKEITSLTESINLVASEASAIRGTVTKNGQLVQGQVLYLYDGNDQAVGSVKTDIFGEFYFNNIPSGNFKLVLPTENDAIIEAVEYSDQEEVIDLTL